LAATFGARNIISKSIAGALGMNMDLETGNFTVDNGAKKIPPIKEADIIIVDECSMVNEESHALIMAQKRKSAKVIYLGDIRQLPPIREKGSPYQDRPSPVFFGKNYNVLTERIRQGEESPILPFADYFGDNSRLTHPVKCPVVPEWRKSITNDHGELLFENNIYDVLDQYTEYYVEAIKEKDPNWIKTIAYRNETRHTLNDYIRKAIYGSEAANETQYFRNEILIFSDNYTVDMLGEPISNSYEFQINKAEPGRDGGYDIWLLDFIVDGIPVTVKTLAASDIKKHTTDVHNAFVYAKSLKFGSEDRKDALSRAWGLKKRYAPLDYAYVITSYKCQGSTYSNVIVYEADIMSVAPINNKEKSQSLYTAITRASRTCVIIN
jgi:hypothetical protein